MMYTVKMMSKDTIQITQEEYQKIISSKATGLVFIERIKSSINLNSVETILHPDLIQEDLTEGRLHDGTRVIKRFGVWVDAVNPDVRLDVGYYPELASGEILSEAEYQTKGKGKQTTRIGTTKGLEQIK